MTIALVQLVENGHYFYAEDWGDDNPDPDIFRYSSGYCNGPECAICKEAKCHHCYPDFENETCPALAPALFDIETVTPVTKKWKSE